MIISPKGLEESSSADSTSIIFNTFLVDGLEDGLLKVYITLSGAIFPTWLLNVLTPACNALVPNVLAVSLTNFEVIPFEILSNVPAPLKVSIYSQVPLCSLYTV